MSHFPQGAEEIVIEIPDHKGIAGSVYTSGTLLNIKDCYTDPRFCRVVDKASQFQTRTMLCAPIRHVLTGEPIGLWTFIFYTFQFDFEIFIAFWPAFRTVETESHRCHAGHQQNRGHLHDE